MNIATWDPFREFSQYVDRYARASDDERTSKAWSPSVDINESDTQYVVSAELPGVEKDDVTVSIDKNVLTIKGEKRLTKKEEGEKWHRVESTYGEFTRSFTLPEEVDTDKVEANYKDGVLALTIPKAEKVQPKLIDVKIS